MKKLFAVLLLLVCAVSALAQPLVSPSQIEPHWGFIRKGPCGNGAGDNCGSDPPTWHITAAQCGSLFSGSNARNSNGTTISTKGVRFTLPTVAELTAAGYTGTGAAGSGGVVNRSGQCEISFVAGGPNPDQYLRIGITGGVNGTDKGTFLPAEASHDLWDGDLILPSVCCGVLKLGWNGTSWVVLAAPPQFAQFMHQGQFFQQGQGRLFVVTADPSWWTIPTKVGSIAYCPLNGRGTTMETNGSVELGVLPYQCVFHTPAAGTLTEWITLRYSGSYVVSGISQGAAYGAGTSPNGKAYSAGNYAIISLTAATALEDGDTMDLHNLPTNLGTVLNGRWLVKKISSTDFELHESVEDFGAAQYAGAPANTATGIGPPSSFVVGDTLNATNPVGASAFVLNINSAANDRTTNPTASAEFAVNSTHETIVGVARRVGGVYTDSSASRNVSSWFNPFEITATGSFSATRTTSSTATFVEPNAESRANFVFLNRTSKLAVGLGDRGEGVRWQLTATVSNATNGDGCLVGVGFDGTTAEATQGKILNPAGTNGASYSITISGVKTGLSELVTHYGTILLEAVTGGTCSVDSVGTTLSLFLRQ